LKAAGPALAGAIAAAEIGRSAYASAAGEPASEPAIWSHEYWATQGDLKLYLFRKRLGASPKPGERLPVLFLVHGSSVSARPTGASA
jgi:hypothetical protein